MEPAMSRDLFERWRTLARQLGLLDSDAIGSELVARYGETHRCFHGHAHLTQVLDVLDELKADPRLHLAAWFHDAVYRPGRNDNEPLSAVLARQRLEAAGLPQPDLELVARAVIATAGHRDVDPAFDPLLDADLAVLGASPLAYQRYREQIRQEFAAIPDLLFGPARVSFLRGMLARRAIYRTPACHLRFEGQAHRNLQNELDQLGGGG
ncbi:MAG: HD domain-containing protein [Pseudomarimonas sp.]